MKELRELFTPRDVPLLFVVLPQAYVVGLWQWGSSGYGAGALTGTAWQIGAWVALFFAILGGIGYEAIYVGSLAWARRLRNARGANAWAFLTSIVALIFSVGVAVYHYRAQGQAAWLHAGLPIVGFFYTVMTFAAHNAAPAPALGVGQERATMPQSEAPAVMIATDEAPARNTPKTYHCKRCGVGPMSFSELGRHARACDGPPMTSAAD
jgi:hypothetical protein